MTRYFDSRDNYCSFSGQNDVNSRGRGEEKRWDEVQKNEREKVTLLTQREYGNQVRRSCTHNSKGKRNDDSHKTRTKC